MNELIKECWLKAAREDSGEKWDPQEEFIERFAKLIVKECAEVAGCNGHVSGFTLGDLIKEHFGIE